jgi:trk system potassium uptake protein TrkA
MVWPVSAPGGITLHVVIAGCGRVGSHLAVALDELGHDVAIIDKNSGAFRRLGDGFGGQTVEGIVFDRAALEKAGVRRAQAFIAVTSGDNSNIVSARTAKEHYGVENAVARIYDPERALIYERLGVTTIASARWTAEEVLRALLPQSERVETSIGPGHGHVVVVTLAMPEGVHGLDAAELSRPGQSVVAAVTRGGATRVPPAGALLEAGDIVHVAVSRDAVDALRERVAGLGEERS